MIDIDENVSNEEMKEHDPHHPRRNDLSFFNLIDSWELVPVSYTHLTLPTSDLV